MELAEVLCSWPGCAGHGVCRCALLAHHIHTISTKDVQKLFALCWSAHDAPSASNSGADLADLATEPLTATDSHQGATPLCAALGCALPALRRSALYPAMRLLVPGQPAVGYRV